VCCASEPNGKKRKNRLLQFLRVYVPGVASERGIGENVELFVAGGFSLPDYPHRHGTVEGWSVPARERMVERLTLKGCAIRRWHEAL